MLDFAPLEIRLFCFSLAVGVTVPLLVFWMLRSVLEHFLHAIFRDRRIEKFWLRVVLLVFLGGALSSAVSYHPDQDLVGDYIAIIFSAADTVQAILQSLLWMILALFLPLLLSYTVLHVGRDRRQRVEERPKEQVHA